MKTPYYLGLALIITLAACDSNRSKANIGDSKDTTSVNSAVNPPIQDTATINKERQDSVKSAKSDTATGNADPTGRPQN
jgi:hypothetical protein